MPLDIDHLLSLEGPIARRLDGYETRPEQLQMAAAVQRTMQERGDLIVEAGTGVGKSFAYLIPAIQRVVDHGEKVVVVTNTINLQEQLIEKDIPLLNAVIPEEFSAVLVKGRNNYLSLRRLKVASERQERMFGDEETRHALHAVEEWAYETRDGSLSTLPVLNRMNVWDAVRSDAHNCMGRRCPTYDKCFYQAARRRMENGDLLICNHALFFADLSLRSHGVGFLPPYQHVIIDEAHCVEDVAAEHFGLSLTESRVYYLLGLLYQTRTRKGFLESVRLESDSTGLLDHAIRQALECRDVADCFFGDLYRWQKDEAPENGRVAAPKIVENPLTDAMRALRDLLKLLRPKATQEADQFELASYAQRAEDIASDAEALIDQNVSGCVYFVEEAARRRGRTGRPQVGLHCRVVEVSDILTEHLFDKDISVTLTSATLATAPNDFSHLAGRLGCSTASTLHLGSPFDHAAQMKVVIDPTIPEPRHPAYIDSLVPRIEEAIRATDGGAFVLFTSFRMIHEVVRRLGEPLRSSGHPVLVHGVDGSPGLLIKRFREDERSVLFGTASFWQGVDVRGRALRNVIITRLPFDVPDRPLIEARLERIADRGGRPFFEEQIPRAVIRFKQGVGRLIRSQTDEGQVVVLDPRIVTKPYGRAFLAALPDGVQPEVVGISDCDDQVDW